MSDLPNHSKTNGYIQLQRLMEQESSTGTMSTTPTEAMKTMLDLTHSTGNLINNINVLTWFNIFANEYFWWNFGEVRRI